MNMTFIIFLLFFQSTLQLFPMLKVFVVGDVLRCYHNFYLFRISVYRFLDIIAIDTIAANPL